jgi:membrane protease YdiL (CAAX protease family)
MSTDPSRPEPDDSGITGQPPEGPAEPEPFLAETDDDEEHVVAAELVELEEPARLRLRFRRPAPPKAAGPPHPGFWWAILWCILMLIVAQIVPAVLVTFIYLGVEIARHGLGGGDPGDAQELQKVVVPPTVLLSQVTLILFSLLVLRLVAGRDWGRQVGLRLPSVTHLVLAVLAWPALVFAASGVYQGAQLLPGLSHILSYLVSVCGMLAAVGVAWVLVHLITGRDWVKELAALPASAQLVLAPPGCLLAAGVGALIFYGVDPYLPTFELPGMADMMGNMVKEFRTWPPLAGVLIIGLGPGLGEELWCRAFLGRGLVGRHGVVMGVILTSLFFGAIHVDPHQGTMAAILGLALHFSYLMTRSLLIPMLLHFLVNSLSIIADKLPEFGRQRLENIDTNPAGIPWQVLAASACLLAAVGLALYTSRGRLVRADGNLPPWQPPYPGVAHPPPDSGTEVVYPWPGVLPTLAVIAGAVGLGCAMYWA